MPKKKLFIDPQVASHVAASPIMVGNRVIQRCLVCGEKLSDSYDEEKRVVWSEGELVRSKYGFLHSLGQDFVELPTMNHIPIDFCLGLVEM